MANAETRMTISLQCADHRFAPFKKISVKLFERQKTLADAFELSCDLRVITSTNCMK